MVTLASLLDAASVVIAATILTTFVDVVLRVFPKIDGMILTFIASLVLYVAVFVSVANFTIEGGFTVFLAWLGCAAAALGVHKAIFKPTGISDAIQGGK